MLRMLNTNLDGRQKVVYALTKIRGIGRRFSNLIVKRAHININSRYVLRFTSESFLRAWVGVLPSVVSGGAERQLLPPSRLTAISFLRLTKLQQHHNFGVIRSARIVYELPRSAGSEARHGNVELLMLSALAPVVVSCVANQPCHQPNLFDGAWGACCRPRPPTP